MHAWFRHWSRTGKSLTRPRPQRAWLILERLEDRITPSGAPFVEPPVLHSVNGVLTATLTESVGPAQVGDTLVQNAWTYNGLYAGPTLMANPGDVLDITVINDLPDPTNLHTHGLHVSPLGNSDDVLLGIDPGGSNHYRIQIPTDESQGLYWYHPHMHGFVNEQIAMGLSGLLVIGRPDGGAPELDGLPQRLIGLKNALLDGDQIVTPPDGPFDPNQQIFLVNGQLKPDLTIPVGEWDVFNVANIGNNAFYNLQLFDVNTQQQVPVLALAEDGNPLTQASAPQGGPGAGPALGAPPGRRWSFTFAPPNSTDTFILQTAGFNDGTHLWPPRDLMTIHYTLPANPTPTVTTGMALTPPENLFQDLADVPESQIAVHRTVVFGETEVDGEMIDTINGAQFPNNPLFQPRLNTVEEWTLINPTVNDHPFHMHTDPQQVIQPNGGSGGGNSLNGQDRWQDVINVPAGKTVVIRIEFTDFLGEIVFHCHRVDHEDNGMMSLVNIVSQSPIDAVGSGNSGEVKAYDPVTGQQKFDFFAFDHAPGGVRVAIGDVNGDGITDIVCGTGPGVPAQVKVFSGLDGALLYNFLPFTAASTMGIYVAAGDINSDGYSDIIVGADAGAAPEVKVFGGGTVSGQQLLDFMAYDPAFMGGVRVAAGDLNGDGRIELITGAGPGAAPHVKVFHDMDLELIASFFAFDVTFHGGVYVGVGNVKGYAYTDLIIGAGAGGLPEVKVYSDLVDPSMSHMHGGELMLTQIRDFAAYSPTVTSGVQVGSVHRDYGDDIVTGTGPGSAPEVKTFDGKGGSRQLSDFFAFNPALNGGVSVGGPG